MAAAGLNATRSRCLLPALLPAQPRRFWGLALSPGRSKKGAGMV